jgi:ATP-dependent DNA helicase PIF1
MVLLNSRHKDNVKQHDDSITLSTTRAIAKAFNKEKLDSLKGECMMYWGTLRGTFKENANIDNERHDNKLPAPYKLELKKDAQIIMLKNDPDLRWVNGTIGKIHKLKSDCIWVNIKGKKYRVEKELWTETDYVLDPESNDIDKITVGEYLQFPLSLAYAITIHKSQGKTFDKITVDVGKGAFAHGQVYVALSRCRSIEDIVLDNPINDKDIIVDPRIIEFINTRQIPDQTLFPANEPTQVIKDKIINAIEKELHVFIEYQNTNGGTSQRELSNISFPDETDKKFVSRNLITAFCHLAEEERTFRIDRILSIETL